MRFDLDLSNHGALTVISSACAFVVCQREVIRAAALESAFCVEAEMRAREERLTLINIYKKMRTSMLIIITTLKTSV